MLLLSKLANWRPYLLLIKHILHYHSKTIEDSTLAWYTLFEMFILAKIAIGGHISYYISLNLTKSHLMYQISMNFTIAHQISLDLTKSHHISLILTKTKCQSRLRVGQYYGGGYFLKNPAIFGINLKCLLKGEAMIFSKIIYWNPLP